MPDRCPATQFLPYTVPPCTVACELAQGHEGKHRARVAPAPYDEIRWPEPNDKPGAKEAPKEKE